MARRRVSVAKKPASTIRSRCARATFGWMAKWSAISLTVLAPLRSRRLRIAARVGSERTFAVLVAESSPRFATGVF